MVELLEFGLSDEKLRKLRKEYSLIENDTDSTEQKPKRTSSKMVHPEKDSETNHFGNLFRSRS